MTQLKENLVTAEKIKPNNGLWQRVDEKRLQREERLQDLFKEEEEDDGLGKVYDGRLVRRLADFNLPYLRQLTLAIVFMAFSSLLSVAGPWIIGQAIDVGIRNNDLAALRFWSLLFIVAALI